MHFQFKTLQQVLYVEHGIQVLGISCVTNLAAGISQTHLSHQEVFEAGSRVQHRLAALFTRLAPQLATAEQQP